MKLPPEHADGTQDGHEAGWVAVERVEWTDGRALSGPDHVAAEEPLEIRVGGVPLAVVMRTPGYDHDLARGFLVTERIVQRPSQIESVRHCSAATDDAEDNIVQVILRPDVTIDLARLRRNLYASSSCGICGKATIESVMDKGHVLHDDLRLSAATLYELPRRLQEGQSIFTQTGGLHAAGLFDNRGCLKVVREDIGRHNAVDKVVGWAFVHVDFPLRNHVLLVSGRVSYEVVQKAVASGISVVAGISAPSSLAVSLARTANVTLVGFLRGQRLVAYTGHQRIS